jgi:hypothetical protein
MSRVETRTNTRDGASQDSDSLILGAVHDTHTMMPKKADKTT